MSEKEESIFGPLPDRTSEMTNEQYIAYLERIMDLAEGKNEEIERPIRDTLIPFYKGLSAGDRATMKDGLAYEVRKSESPRNHAIAKRALQIIEEFEAGEADEN